MLKRPAFQGSFVLRDGRRAAMSGRRFPPAPAAHFFLTEGMEADNGQH